MMLRAPHTLCSFALLMSAESALAAEPEPNPPAPALPVVSPDPPANPPAPENTPPTPDNAPSEPAAPNDRPEQPLPDKPAVTPPQKGLPHIRIEADRPGVRLLRIDRVMSDEMGEGMLVSTVCTAPCNQVIDGRKRQTFFFGAEGMVPSRGFRLARLDGHIVANVQGGSIVAKQLGFLFGGFGGAAVIGGATMLGVGYSQDTHISSEGKIVEGSNPTLTRGGFITLGIGAAMVTTAVVLILTAKTKISLVQADDQSARVTFDNGVFRF